VNQLLKSRIGSELTARMGSGTFRELRTSDPAKNILNLASNDYLGLSSDPRLQKAGQDAISKFGCSSSASPLVTGFGEAHRDLLALIESWYGFETGIVWNTGYVANQALLSLLPKRGDLVLADRLIHNSMISGVLASDARLLRYRHCDLEHLEGLLKKYAVDDRVLFIVTESVFSMDGDFPDLKRIADLKEKYGFFWILDEAHAVGWYGKEGSGLAEEFGVLDQVDALVGTLGKALGSMGAYTLFREKAISDYLINFAGEFIYSTYLPPACAAIAIEAIRCVRKSSSLRKRGRDLSTRVRKLLEQFGLDVLPGDSPIISIQIGEADRVVDLARELENRGILAGAIRPPTVPEGTSRLRISLKADLSDSSTNRFLKALEAILIDLKWK